MVFKLLNNNRTTQTISSYEQRCKVRYYPCCVDLKSCVIYAPYLLAIFSLYEARSQRKTDKICVHVCFKFLFTRVLPGLRLVYVWTPPCTPSRLAGIAIPTESRIRMPKWSKSSRLQFPDSTCQTVDSEPKDGHWMVAMRPNAHKLCPFPWVEPVCVVFLEWTSTVSTIRCLQWWWLRNII